MRRLSAILLFVIAACSAHRYARQMCVTSVVLGLCGLGVSSTYSLEVSVDYLFSLDASRADVTYRDRPTPTLAVDSQGRIAFPLRSGEIAAFSSAGRVIYTVDGSPDGYPLRMSFGQGGNLVVLDQSGSRLIDLATGNALPYTIDNWLSLVAPAVAADLRRCGVVFESGTTIAWDTDSAYFYETPTLASVSRKSCKRQTVAKGPLGYLIGAATPRDFLFLNTTNDCFLVSVRNGKEVNRKPIEGIAGRRPTVAKLDPSPKGNSGETNKANRRRGWYWSAADGKLYKVMHAPAGFHFFEYNLRAHDERAELSRDRIPKHVEECFVLLAQTLSAQELSEFKTTPEAELAGAYHMGLGLRIRNNWIHANPSALKDCFRKQGIDRPDDMSAIVLMSFHRHLNSRPIHLEKQIAYWKGFEIPSVD